MKVSFRRCSMILNEASQFWTRWTASRFWQALVSSYLAYRLVFDTDIHLDVYKKAIDGYQDAKQTLSAFLRRNVDRVVRLSTAATYCELGWGWPLETTQGELELIMSDVSELLKSDRDCRRACMYLPSLCKRTELKAGLINDANLKTLVQLCDTTRIIKHEEGPSAVALHSAQALSMLMKCTSTLFDLARTSVDDICTLVDDGLAKKLVDIDLVTDITEALRSNCK